MLTIVVLIYLRLMIFSLGMTNIIIIVIVLELFSWLFTLILQKSSVIKYLIIQTIFFFVRVLGLLWRKTVLLVGVMVKMGVPPFHLWFLNISQYITKYIFLFFRTIHKIIPMFFFIKTMLVRIIIAIALLTIAMSVIFIMEVGSLYFIIIFSTITHRGWIILLCFVRYRTLFLYWFTYLLLIILFFFRIPNIFINKRDENQNALLSIIWLIICGLPPFTMFFLKVNLLRFFIEKSIRFRLVLMVVAILSLAIYYRVFHISILTNKITASRRIFIPLILCIGWY